MYSANFYSRFSLSSKPLTSASIVVGLVGVASMITLLNYPNFFSSESLAKKKVMNNLLTMPLSFEANKGQISREVSYFSRGHGYTLYFTPKEIVLDFQKAAIANSKFGKFKGLPSTVASSDLIRVQFVGANQNPIITGKEKIATKTNYLIGNDPKKWQTDVPNYGRVDYQNLYRGVDMTFYGNQDKLEYDIRVAPGADPSQARFHIAGANKMHLNLKGDLVITTPEGKDVSMHNPVIYQTINGVKHSVTGNFKLLADNNFQFEVGAYDKTQTLVIDPQLTMATFIGGPGGANAILAIDIGQNVALPQIYATGYTDSIAFPNTTDGEQPSKKGHGINAFVLKYDRSTNSILYATYLGGGGGNDRGFAIAVDANNAAYIGGETNSPDFPLQNPFQATNKGAKDFSGFVTKLNPEGNGLVYSTYLGGSGDNQEVNGIAVDGSGFAYVTGETTSKDFPLRNPFQSTHKGTGFTAYVTKLNTLGNNLIWSTYLGGSGSQDECNGIKVDAGGQVYVTGETNSKDFPLANPIQPTPGPAGAGQTGFVAKINSSGSALMWSTYLGGSGGNDYPNAIDIDDLQNVYVAGYTNSSDFPVVNALQTTNNGPNFTGFVTKINALGNGLIYSSYIGGSGGNDRINAISVDVERHAHFNGYTNSTDFPLKNAMQAANLGPNITGFAASVDEFGVLVNSTYVGGSGGNDRLYAVVMDRLTNVYSAGYTNSADFPLLDALQTVKTADTMAVLRNVSL